MNRILVTGGAGFIGSHLCEALIRQGYHVAIIDNFNHFYLPESKRNNYRDICLTAKKYHLKNNITLFEGDIRDHHFVDDVFRTFSPDAVIHLAAYAGVRPSLKDPILYTDVNVNGTVILLEAMKKHGVKRHVFASSSSVYGNNRKVPFAESDPVDYPISFYASTKKTGELICHTYHHLYEINTACLRFFTVYGPRQRPDLAIHKFTKLMLEGLPVPFYGDGTTVRDYTYIDDIIDGILKALDWTAAKEKRYEIFNLGESRTISLTLLLATLEKELGCTAILDRMPKQPGDVDATFADVAKARAILGYNPQTEFVLGIKSFVKWYRDTMSAKYGQ